MTQFLEQAIAELYKLSATEQDAMASLILSEIEDERRWDDAFANSQDKLRRMAEKVRDDISAGRVRDMGIDEL